LKNVIQKNKIIESKNKSTKRLRRHHPASSEQFPKEISDKLYEDAKRRQSEKFQNLRKSLQRERSAEVKPI
jgi:hypothetical protein